MAALFDPRFQVVDGNGRPHSGAKLAFYRAGTSSLVAIYQNAAGSTPHTNPVLADASGVFPPIYLDTSYPYKAILLSASGVTLQTIEYFDAVGSTIADDAVTTPKIVDAAVTETKLPSSLVRDFRLVDPNGPKPKIIWAGAQLLTVYGSNFAMGGWRTFGRFELARAVSFPAPLLANNIDMQNPSQMSHGMQTRTGSNWYGVFAVANNGDSQCRFEINPFLYVKSVTGSTVTFGTCGEVTNVTPASRPTASYDWDTAQLVGAEVMAITEKASSQAFWTFRKTTIVSATASTLTLSSILSIKEGCILMIKPTGCDHFAYLTSVYTDTAEIRNTYDLGGGTTRSRMQGGVGGWDPIWAHGNDGTRTTYLDGPVDRNSKVVELWGFIPPFATGVYFQSTFLLATTTTDKSATIIYDMDGTPHAYEDHRFTKTGASSVSDTQTIFLGFNSVQTYRPFTQGEGALVYGVRNWISGWYEP